jgi:hypothetical protein
MHVSLWLSASILFIGVGAAISRAWPVSGPSKTHAGFVAHLIVEFFEWFGELAMFCWRTLRRAVTPPYEIRELVRQLDAIGPNRCRW